MASKHYDIGAYWPPGFPMHCIFILGAGRSGTSLAASLFAGSDASPVSSYAPRAANPYGFFEDQRVNAINEKILSRYLPSSCLLSLREYGSSVPGPGQYWLSRLSTDLTLSLLPDEQREIESILGKGSFCIKDPRLSYTLSLWLDSLSLNQKASAKLICIFRDPSRVLSSVVHELLNARYLHSLSISIDQILESWRLQYQWILSRHSCRGDWFFVDYESMFNPSTVRALEAFCGMSLQAKNIDSGLNRSQACATIHGPTSELFLHLQRLAHDSLRKYSSASSPAVFDVPKQVPVVMTLLCRDEVDIIGAHLDFHLAMGVDYFFITDNASNDGTFDFLCQYRQDHPVTLLQEGEHIHDQGRWVSHMAALAYERFGECWLIHSDADEFWQPRVGDLRGYLRSLGDDVRAISVKRCNLLPPPLNNSNSGVPFYANLSVREVDSRNALGNPLPPKIAHRAMANVRVGEGNHAVFCEGKLVEALNVSDIDILHVPVRGLRQLERKIRNGSEALNRNSSLPKSVGATWRHLGEMLEREGSLESYYKTLLPSSDQIQAGLKDGRYCLDGRIPRVLSGVLNSEAPCNEKG